MALLSLPRTFVTVKSHLYLHFLTSHEHLWPSVTQVWHLMWHFKIQLWHLYDKCWDQLGQPLKMYKMSLISHLAVIFFPYRLCLWSSNLQSLQSHCVCLLWIEHSRKSTKSRHTIHWYTYDAKPRQSRGFRWQIKSQPPRVPSSEHRCGDKTMGKWWGCFFWVGLSNWQCPESWWWGLPSGSCLWSRWMCHPTTPG